MQLSDYEYVCDWCSNQFPRRHNHGRRPVYCDRTCRQRAYENRRRGANAVGLPRPTVADRGESKCKRYQAGVGGGYLDVAHALRPDGAADHIGFRPTMCGTYVKPSIRPFYEGYLRNCETCEGVVRGFPAERNIDPLAEVGTATALIRLLAAARRASEPVLRAQVDEMLAIFGAPAGASRASRRPRVNRRASPDGTAACASP